MIEKLISIGLGIALVSLMTFLVGAGMLLVGMIAEWFLY